MTAIPHLTGLDTVIDRYDGVILDLWGVVHDGIAPFPWTIGTLRALKDAGRKIWLLSNAPRRLSVVTAHLSAMGVTQDLYDGLLTSGEAAHDALQSRLLTEWGRRCYPSGAGDEKNLLAGSGVDFVDDPAKADFVMAGGGFASRVDFDRLLPKLAACAGAGLPMLCANPDRIVHVGDRLIICPGAQAAAYEDMGQRVEWYGKPYPSVYDRILRDMGTRNVLAVGDGLETDVAGARGAGLDVALVTAGIHRDVFFPAVNGMPARESVPETGNGWLSLLGSKAAPTYFINGLHWNMGK